MSSPEACKAYYQKNREKLLQRSKQRYYDIKAAATPKPTPEQFRKAIVPPPEPPREWAHIVFFQ